MSKMRPNEIGICLSPFPALKYISLIVLMTLSLFRPAVAETGTPNFNPATAAWYMNVSFFGAGQCIAQFMQMRGYPAGGGVYYSTPDAAYNDFVSGMASLGFTANFSEYVTPPSIGFTVGIVDPADNCHATIPNQVPGVVITYAGSDAGKGWGNANGNPGSCNAKAGSNPITIWNGNEFKSILDYSTYGQHKLELTRYYNSEFFAQTAAVSLGSNWRSTYDRYLNLSAWSPTFGNYVIAERADGQLLTFYANSGAIGTYRPDSDVNISLSYNGTTFTLVDSDGTVETYTRAPNPPVRALLTSITTRGGYTQNLSYNGTQLASVTDSYGRSLSFTYSGALLSTVTTPDGLAISYNYTTVSRLGVTTSLLTSVSYSTTPVSSQTYNYTNSNFPLALTAIIDENGNQALTVSYDNLGRATSSVEAGNTNTTTIVYNDADIVFDPGTHITSYAARTVTNALGQPEIYKFTQLQGVLKLTEIDRQATPTTAAATRLFTYDSNGYSASQTDCNGNQTSYVNDSLGQPTMITEGQHPGSTVVRTTNMQWDSTWRQPLEIAVQNQSPQTLLTTDFTYDPTYGWLSTLTQTDGTGNTLICAPDGTLGIRSWSFNYYMTSGLLGLLNTVTGPLSGQTTTYTWQIAPPGSTTPPAGTAYLGAVTDPLNHTTNVTATNGSGQPLTTVDPNGVSNVYTYDIRGRILSITVNSGASPSALTSFTYDLVGNIKQIVLPDSAVLSYYYDSANRLNKVTNNLGEIITYGLDAFGDRTSRIIKSSSGTITKQQTATFDWLGRILQSIGAASQPTTYTYDNEGNPVTVQDPRSKLYSNAFDALNRLYQQTDPDSFVTTVSYDVQDNVIGATDARSLPTTYVRDGFGDVIQQASPDTGTTNFCYDANGAVTKQVDARSVETDYTNDLTGRVLTKSFPTASAENVTYGYDAVASGNKGIGYLTSVTDQSGSTTLVYDALGHVITDTRVINGHSYVTVYTYDPTANVLTTITYPSGRIVSYSRDTLGRISGITTKQNSGAAAVTVASGVSYKPFGPLTGLTFGNGLLGMYTYDQDYQLTGIGASGGGATVQSLTNGYDPAGNITSITDALVTSRSQTIGYDDLNRVNSASGAYGSQGYTYDGVGNRLTRVVGGTTETYTYYSGTNRINTVTAGGNVRTFTYQPSGQVSQDVRTPSQTYTFAANNNGRNTSAALNATTAGAYLYNAFEQRVQKTVGSTVTQFVHDQGGHLLVEANGSGATQREYIWLDDMPVAMVDDTGTAPVLYFIHTDQLGTPQKITNTSAVVVWDGVFDPFGNAVGYTAGVWDTSKWDQFLWGGDLLLTNLRFPGQDADAETALNQNWFRDYDPTIGRYIQSDPIGLSGGVNLYSYVSGNPITRYDPLGNWGASFSLYARGFGAGLTVYGPGDTPNLSSINAVSVQFPYGSGGGYNVDPNAQPPGYPPSCSGASSFSFNLQASLGVNGYKGAVTSSYQTPGFTLDVPPPPGNPSISSYPQAFTPWQPSISSSALGSTISYGYQVTIQWR